MLISVGPSVQQLRTWLECADNGFDTLEEADAIENARSELRWAIAYLEVLDDVQDALAVLPGIERLVFGEPLSRDGEIINLANGERVGTVLAERITRTGLDAINDNVSGLGFPNHMRRECASISLVDEDDQKLPVNRTAKRLLGKNVARLWSLERLRSFRAFWREWVHWLADHGTTFFRFSVNATVAGCRTIFRAGGSRKGDLK